MKKLFTGLLALFLFVITYNFTDARSGCCSHHSGVCGCSCCDGSSLSATCAPYYPECSNKDESAGPSGGNSTYSLDEIYKRLGKKTPSEEREEMNKKWEAEHLVEKEQNDQVLAIVLGEKIEYQKSPDGFREGLLKKIINLHPDISISKIAFFVYNFLPDIKGSANTISTGIGDCNCSKTCNEMSSCAEAQHQFNDCGCSARDADHDGIACDEDCQ